MDQRVAFIADWLRDEWTMTELAERYQISRKTALQVGGSLRGGPGSAGWPIGRGRRRCTGARWRTAIARRSWRCGARIRTGGRRSCGRSCGSGSRGTRWPAASTMGDLLAPRGGQSAASSHALRRAVDAAVGAAQAPNDVWTADFKGWFRTADQTRCDPLTVADACSRFVLCCRIVAPQRARACGPGSSGRFASMGCRGAADRQRLAVRDDRRGPACRIWRCGG